MQQLILSSIKYLLIPKYYLRVKVTWYQKNNRLLVLITLKDNSTRIKALKIQMDQEIYRTEILIINKNP